jgi:hypothetical protein
MNYTNSRTVDNIMLRLLVFGISQGRIYNKKDPKTKTQCELAGVTGY